MQAHGNGSVTTCVTNLCRLIRGEVPFERMKGLDPNLIDKPSATAAADLTASAAWVIEHYEPRASADSVTVQAALARTGDFKTLIELSETEE